MYQVTEKSQPRIIKLRCVYVRIIHATMWIHTPNIHYITIILSTQMTSPRSNLCIFDLVYTQFSLKGVKVCSV